MRILFYTPWPNADAWLAGLRAGGPEFTFLRWPEVGRPETVEAALVWRPPAGLFDDLTGLRLIYVMGAGVDHLFAPEMNLPDVPIARLVDPCMAERMASYVLGAVLHHHRQFGAYARQQAGAIWQPLPARDTGEVRVGVLGLGPMGQASAELLVRVGYDVAGWSRRRRAVPGVRCLAGESEWQDFLARSDFLICLLPLTRATRGILNAATFAGLPRGAVVINAARGGHLVENDLLAALEGGQLGGAVLDVFDTEPLPAGNPLWRHPRVLITPHIASLSNPSTGVPQILAALRDVRAGRKPAHLIDPADYR